MSELLKNRRLRDTALQIGFVGAILLALAMFAVTGKTNLEAQGMTSGFGFLQKATGWRIGFSLIEYDTSSPYWLALVVGLLNSLLLGFICLPLATLIGVTIGVMRTSGNGMAELVGTLYVETFRNVPLILQLLFWYALLLSLPSPRDAVPILGGIVLSGRGFYFPALNVSGGSVMQVLFCILGAAALSLWLQTARWQNAHPASARRERRALWALALVLIVIAMWLGRLPETAFVSIPEQRGLNYQGGVRLSPELMACIIAISVYGAAYIAEITRAGFNAVPKGQGEAGHALGLTKWQILSRIRLPLAIRIVMPTMINQYVWLFKATTIGIAIGFADFFMVVSTSIVQSGQTLELIGILMGGFLIINYSLAWVLNRVNDAIKLKGTQLRI